MVRSYRKNRRRGFSLIELVIVVVIIGIIAAIAIPRMSRGSAGAADSALAQDLSILRNAIDMYQTEHNGSYPAVIGTVTVSDQLLKYSDITGATVTTSKDTVQGTIYGPYLRSIPALPVGPNKGGAGIAAASAAGVGWIYDSTAGTVGPNTPASGTGSTDSAGKLYSSY
jgi:prepilin-type N-terminal cleavage/methylation domain-containing protein